MIKKYFTLIVLLVLFGTGARAQCKADFSHSVSNVFTYGFINLSDPPDPNATFQWSFGDDSTSTKENPSHTYKAFGKYVVCLTMHSPLLSCTDTHCDTIDITCPAVAGFNFTRGTNYAYNFNYTSSSNSTVTWDWNFGDNTTHGTTRTLSHTFAHTGIFHVCLTVTDVNTHCTDDTCLDISVCTAQSNYTYTHSSPLDYSFTDGSFGEDASTLYHWDFGNGDTSNVKSPSYTFKHAGTYDVCFSINVVDSGCTNKSCKSISVACPDSANFTYANIGGTTFQFTDISTGTNSSTTYAWSFGDGTSSPDKNPKHRFTDTGVHGVCLTIDNVDQGCRNTFCTNVTIACNDSAGFTYTNIGATYHFANASQGADTTTKFEWTFDGTGTVTDSNPTHTFATEGTHQVCLKITVDGFCTSKFCESVNVTNGINDISASNIRLYPNPTTGWVNVDISGVEAFDIQIFNPMGEKVKQVKPAATGKTPVDISALPQGLYFVSIILKDNVYSVPLTVLGK